MSVVVRLMIVRCPKVAAFVGFVCLTFSAGQAVSAPVLNPANGHYYEWISVPGGVTWSAAKAQAESSVLFGQPGYLVTFTDTSEEAFVYSLPGTGTGWGGASDAAVEGEWRWQGGPEAGTLFWTGGISGTASGYENWGRDNSMTVYVEPNSVGDEDCLELRPGSGYGFGWNDVSCAATETRYVVEYGSPCGTFLLKWGTTGTGDGQFNHPEGLAIGPDGSVYVAEFGNNRIQKFDGNGNFLLKWGSSGVGDGQFSGPAGVAVDNSGNVYVVEYAGERVQKFTSTGAFLTKWGSPGSGDGQFDNPAGIAVDAAGNVYVSELGNNRVQKFTDTGTFVAKWGSVGSGDGQFVSAFGLAVDSVGDVYVADFGNRRVQKFTNAGSFLTKWGSGGSGDGQFLDQEYVAVDAIGNVFVSDLGNYRVQKFTSAGSFLTKWGSNGSGDGQFSTAVGIGVDAGGGVYIADAAANRIQKFACPPPTTSTTTSTSSSSTTSTTLAPPELIPGRIGIVKPTTLAKFVAKPATGDTFVLPTGDPLTSGGSLRILDTSSGAGDNTYNLPASGWKGLGNPAGSKGYKYEGAGTPSDPCKVVLVKEKVIKGVCKGTGIAFTTPFAGEVGIILSLGTTDRYCASFGGDEVKNDGTLTKRKNAPAPGSCPVVPTTSTSTTSTSSTTTTSLISGCFTDIGDGTIYDTCTSLQWEKKTDDATVHDKDNTYTWSASGTAADGTAYTSFLPGLNTPSCYAGYCDWRLPTVAELQSIVDLAAPGCGSGSACINGIFGPTAVTNHWSSETDGGNPFAARIVSFSNGAVGTDGKNGAWAVRAVR